MMESVDEPVNVNANVWLRIIRHSGTLLYYIVYPIIVLTWNLLSLLLSFLGILLAPFVYIVQVISYVVGAPFRFLAKFEPLCYFLGYAVLVGGVAGVLLFFAYRFLGYIFNLSSEPEREQPKSKGSYSVDAAPVKRECSEATASEARTESIPCNPHFDSKPIDRFTLSEFYADWVDRDDLIPLKEPEMISSTIIEEEDDSQEAWE